jgi:hypothetical protein
LLWVSRSSRWGRGKSIWSKYIYFRRFLLPSPDVTFFWESNSRLKQVLRFLHRAWISFPTTNGKISTIRCFRFSSCNLICQIYFSFNNEYIYCLQVPRDG